MYVSSRLRRLVGYAPEYVTGWKMSRSASQLMIITAML